jgi:hypothetical protein
MPSVGVRPQAVEWLRYSNHTMVSGRAVGHGSWGGQYALANLEAGAIGVFFSVLETHHAITREYVILIVRMLEAIAGMEPESAT